MKTLNGNTNQIDLNQVNERVLTIKQSLFTLVNELQGTNPEIAESLEQAYMKVLNARTKLITEIHNQ